MYGYISIRILVFFVIALALLIVLSYILSGDVDDNRLVNFLKIFLFELPVAATSSVFITYSFTVTQKSLDKFQRVNLVSAFTPAIFFALSVVVIIVFLQDIVLPNLTKQKLINEGVKDVVFSIDKDKYLVIDKVEFDKNGGIYLLKGVDLVSKQFSVIRSYSQISYNPIKNALVMGVKELEMDKDLEKILMFFVDKNYFFSIWEFNDVKDAFFMYDIKTSFLNFVMYEKIFMPLLTFVIMIFAITFGWRWRINRETKLMPLYILVGFICITIGIKMVYYLSIRLFEFLVFPF
ncbi:MAG: hypothetical protein N2712_05575 [Brevinematales bacterium]|nr:hypothetical protein [Brevinematales bacterium]